MSDCCNPVGDRLAPTWVRRAREVFAWILPGAILVFAPKCPACLAAQVTLWTGLGLSFSTASYLRWMLLLVCITSLLLLTAKAIGCRLLALSYQRDSLADGREPTADSHSQ